MPGAASEVLDGQVARERLSVRLAYAQFKVSNGWTDLAFDEVEGIWDKRFLRCGRGEEEVVRAVKRIAREEESGTSTTGGSMGDGIRGRDESGGRSAVSLGKRRAVQPGEGEGGDDGRGVDPYRTVINRSNIEVPSSTTLPTPAPSTAAHRYDYDSMYSTTANARIRPVNSTQLPTNSTRTQHSSTTSATPLISPHNIARLFSPRTTTLPTSYESFWATLASPATSTTAGITPATASTNGKETISVEGGGGASSDVEGGRKPIRRPPVSNGTTSMGRSRTEPLPIFSTISPPPSTPPAETNPNPNGKESNGNFLARESHSPSTSQTPFLTYASLSPSTTARQPSLSPQSYRPFAMSTEHRYGADRYNSTPSQEDPRRLSQVSRRSTGGVLGRMTGSQLLSDPVDYAIEERTVDYAIEGRMSGKGGGE